MNSRPVGIAGLGPLFGVRAIADAAGLDRRQVMALMESGAGHSLAPRIAAPKSTASDHRVIGGTSSSAP